MSDTSRKQRLKEIANEAYAENTKSLDTYIAVRAALEEVADVTLREAPDYKSYSNFKIDIDSDKTKYPDSTVAATAIFTIRKSAMDQTRHVTVEFGISDDTMTGKIIAEGTRFKYGPDKVADFNERDFSGRPCAKDLIEPLQDLLAEVISLNKAELDYQSIESQKGPIIVMRHPSGPSSGQ